MAATLSLFIRKSSHDDWGDFGRLLVLLIPFVLFYGLGLGLGDRELARAAAPPLDRGLLVRSRRVAPAWQTVHVVLAVILAPFVLTQFLELIGGNSNDSLNVAWIFLVIAALALYAAFATGVSYASLLASIALIVSWVSVCDKVFDPSASAFRWILLVAAGGLLLVAFELERFDVRQAPEFVTGGGLAALAAAVLGLFEVAIQYVGNSFFRVIGSPSVPLNGPRQHLEWDLLLLGLALFMVWYGTRRRARGPVYVGALALTAFIVSVGLELTRLLVDRSPPEGSFFGWPLLLLLVGAAGLLAGFWAPRDEPTEPPPTEPPLPPPAAA